MFHSCFAFSLSATCVLISVLICFVIINHPKRQDRGYNSMQLILTDTYEPGFSYIQYFTRSCCFFPFFSRRPTPMNPKVCYILWSRFLTLWRAAAGDSKKRSPNCTSIQNGSTPMNISHEWQLNVQPQLSLTFSLQSLLTKRQADFKLNGSLCLW